MSDLSAAIERLYEVFQPYTPYRRTGGCPCCIESIDLDRLEHAPLRELSARDLDWYAFMLLETVGSDLDYRAFLPRLLELLARDWHGFSFPEKTLGKLREAEWHRWPTRERDAVRQLLARLWEHALSNAPSYSGPPDARELVCGLALAGEDLTPYLATWQTTLSEPSLDHLEDLIREDGPWLTSRQARDVGSWSGTELQERQVLEWLLSPATLEHFERQWMAAPDAPYSASLSRVVSSLEWLDRKWHPFGKARPSRAGMSAPSGEEGSR